MKKFLWIILSLIWMGTKAQTYSPNTGTVSNKPYAPSAAVPTDSRSYFFDSNLFLWRPYQSTSEALTYLQPVQIRAGNFPIFISTGTLQSNGSFTGGQVFVWMFRRGLADSNLVQVNIDGGASGNFLQVANNLSDVANAATARTNLGLGAMAQQNLTAASTDVTGNWPNGLIVNSIQGHNLSFIQNYNNLSNLPTIPAQVNLIAGANMSISGTYPNLTLSASAAAETAGYGINAALAPGGVIAIDSFAYRKMDSLWIVDSALNFTINGKQYTAIIPALDSAGHTVGVSVVQGTNANGVNFSITNPTTTPNITISLSNITPTTVNGLTLNSLTNGFSIQGGTTPATLTVPASANVQGTNTGDVSLTGLTYLTLSGQQITEGAIPLGTSVSGTLLATNFGALTGDVTNSAGSYATTISANAVTYAKIQQVSSGALIGNSTGSTANAQEIRLAYGLKYVTGPGLAVDSNVIYGRTRQILDSAGGGGTTITMGTLNGQTPAANGATITGAQLFLQTVSSTAPGLTTSQEQKNWDSVYNGLKVFSIPVSDTGHGLWTGYVSNGRLLFKTLSGINGIIGSTATDSTNILQADTTFLNLITRRIIDSAVANISGGTGGGNVHGYGFVYGTRNGAGPVKGGDSTYINTGLIGKFINVTYFQGGSQVGISVPDSQAWANNGGNGFSPYFKNNMLGTITFCNVNNISSLTNGGFYVHIGIGGFPDSLDNGTPSPSLTVVPTSLSSFITSTGIPSASQTYTISGTNLTANVIVTAGGGAFQVSQDNTNWFSAMSIAQSGGTIPGQPKTIYVRLDTTVAATYSTSATNSSTGATSQLVAINGSVTTPSSAIFSFGASSFTASGATPFFGDPTTSLSFTDATTGWTLVNIAANWVKYGGSFTGNNNIGMTTGSQTTFTQAQVNNDMYTGSTSLVDTTTSTIHTGIGPHLRFTNLPAGTYDITLFGSIPFSFFNVSGNTTIYGVEFGTGNTLQYSHSFNPNGPSSTYNSREAGPGTNFMSSGSFTGTITSGQTIDIFIGSGVIGATAGSVVDVINALKITKH